MQGLMLSNGRNAPAYGDEFEAKVPELFAVIGWAVGFCDVAHFECRLLYLAAIESPAG